MIVHYRHIRGVWQTFAKDWKPFDNQMLDLMHESYWIVPGTIPEWELR